MADQAIEAGVEGDVELQAPDPDGRNDDPDKVKAVVLTEPLELGMVQAALQEADIDCSGSLIHVPLAPVEVSPATQRAAQVLAPPTVGALLASRWPLRVNNRAVHTEPNTQHPPPARPPHAGTAYVTVEYIYIAMLYLSINPYLCLYVSLSVYTVVHASIQPTIQISIYLYLCIYMYQ